MSKIPYQIQYNQSKYNEPNYSVFALPLTKLEQYIRTLKTQQPDFDIIQKYLKDININLFNGYLLTLAIEQCNLTLIKFFIEKGAQVYDTHIRSALNTLNIDLVKYLRKFRDSNQVQLSFYLEKAVTMNDMDFIYYLESIGLNYKDESKALKLSMETLNEKIFKHLIIKGASLDYTDLGWLEMNKNSNYNFYKIYKDNVPLKIQEKLYQEFIIKKNPYNPVILNSKTMKWIKEWTLNSSKLNNYDELSQEICDNLQTTVMKHKYKIYRGYSFDLKDNRIQDFLTDISDDIKVEKNVPFKLNFKKLSSWSMNLVQAETFSYNRFKNSGGFVLELETKPENILADIRYIAEDSFIAEEEIILKPGNYIVNMIKIQTKKDNTITDMDSIDELIQYLF